MTIVTQPTPIWRAQFFTNADSPVVPCAGGSVNTYQAGTLTPVQTYTDWTGTSLNPTTIVLDAAGSCNLWLDVTQTYKFVWFDSNNVQQGSQDNIPGSQQQIVGGTLPTGGTTNQVLSKVDNTNFNTYWQTISSGGGSPGDPINSIQWNGPEGSGGTFTGDATLTYDLNNNTIKMGYGSELGFQQIEYPSGTTFYLFSDDFQYQQQQMDHNVGWILTTGATQQLQIDQNGTWFLQGDPGASGSILTSGGIGNPPSWQVGPPAISLWGYYNAQALTTTGTINYQTQGCTQAGVGIIYSNGLVTVGIDGEYMITGSVTVSNTTTGTGHVTLAIRKNGSTITYVNNWTLIAGTGDQVNTVVSITGILDLLNGDTVEIYVSDIANGTVVPSYGSFTGQKIA